MNKLLSILVVAVLASAGVALDASAAEVRAGIRARETYVGMPVTFQIQIANAKNFDPPQVPDVPGLRIESVGQPSRNSNVEIVNGALARQSITTTYTFAVTPLKPGSFQIPSIAVRADGETLHTQPLEFVASKSETGDLLFVEIAGKEKEIYVGQSLDLTLKVWVRPYRDSQHQIPLSEGEMWQLVTQRTHWGPFAERIEELAKNNQRPIGTEVLRKDSEGVNHSYYLYEIDATIYPKKPGRIDGSDVRVFVLYPTAIGQSRDPMARMMEEMGFPDRDDFFGGTMFGPRLEIESVRPIEAEAKVEPIEVLEIPIADRPADYRGAVGKYRIAVQATPSDVKAGDPITLLIGVAGTGPMDLVQAPPLAELPALTRDFKVPNEPLAGYVEGARKVFSTTIRPRSAGITRIPPIPFTYFDPEVGKFVTTESEPIEIKVAPADTLALDAVIGRSKASAGPSSAVAAVANGPLLTNHAGNELLENETPAAAWRNSLWVAIAGPPIAVLLLLLTRGQAGVAFLAGRFRSARRCCEAEIESAMRPSEIGAALTRYFAKRLGIRGTADALAIVGALRLAGHRNPAVRCERILDECQSSNHVSFGSGSSLNELKHSALALVAELEAESARVRPQANPTLRRANRAPAATALVAAAVISFACTGAAQAEPLAPAQQQTVLTEANAAYESAVKPSTTDAADAKEGFATAAQKYQLLVDSGVKNSALYFNLGNAYLQSGATGRAIANFRRTLKIDPTNAAARTNLTLAEASLVKKDETTTLPATTSQSTGFVGHLSAVNDVLIRVVLPRTILILAVASWIACWLVVGLRIANFRLPWKSLAAATLTLAVFCGTSYALAIQSLARPTAIVAKSATLHSGDGEQFPPLSGAEVRDGASVDFLRTRGDWAQVRTPAGQVGWLPRAAIETL